MNPDVRVSWSWRGVGRVPDSSKDVTQPVRSYGTMQAVARMNWGSVTSILDVYTVRFGAAGVVFHDDTDDEERQVMSQAVIRSWEDFKDRERWIRNHPNWRAFRRGLNAYLPDEQKLT